jgi:UDP-N-acetylglucosamine 2-epimerase (non-hydrolysing)
VTLHRPSNVDDPDTLRGVLEVLTRLAERLPVLFPVHPRTRKMLEKLGPSRLPEPLRLVDPVGYLDFLSLESGARLLLTDSGGIQEETTILSVPCLTLRDNTERPITVTEGTNQIVGSDPETVWRAAQKILTTPMPAVAAPEFWDGQTAQRIVRVFQSFIASRRAAKPSVEQPPDVSV